jgi:hypothetical protein
MNTGGPIGRPDQQTYKSWNPCILIIIFVALAALDHTVTAIIGFAKPDTAKEWLFVRKNNPLRWTEYSVSASLMLVAIGILSGECTAHDPWEGRGWLAVVCADTPPRDTCVDADVADKARARLVLSIAARDAH